MRCDPHVRSYAASAPVTPDYSGRRYGWPDPYDADVALLRSYMTEEGRGLFVLRAAVRGLKADEPHALVEAYYPEDIRPAYYSTWLTSPQKADYQDGRLVVVAEFAIFPSGNLTERALLEFKKNNRNAQRDLKRQACASYQKQDLDHGIKAEQEADVDKALGDLGEDMGDRLWSAMTPFSSISREVT